jgi:hypothetical protein
VNMLRMMYNPCETREDYRKKLIDGIETLDELDRIKVVAAERMFYRGFIKTFDLAQLE